MTTRTKGMGWQGSGPKQKRSALEICRARSLLILGVFTKEEICVERRKIFTTDHE